MKQKNPKRHTVIDIYTKKSTIISCKQDNNTCMANTIKLVYNFVCSHLSRTAQSVNGINKSREAMVTPESTRASDIIVSTVSEEKEK